MAAEVKLTLHEENDETVSITITSDDPDDDLTDVVLLEFYLKTDSCVPDSDPLTVLLTSDDPAEIGILTQTADLIEAEVYIPGSDLLDPYDRFWRIDAITSGGLRRTAIYGPVTVIDL